MILQGCFSFFYEVFQCLHRIRIIKTRIIRIRKESSYNRSHTLIPDLRHISYHPQEKSSIALYFSIFESMNKTFFTHDFVLSPESFYGNPYSFIRVCCVDSDFFERKMYSIFDSMFYLRRTPCNANSSLNP